MKLLLGTFDSKIEVFDICVRIVTSILMGFIIDFERERKNRPAGLRTHVLVCVASTLIAIVEQQMIYEICCLKNANINLSFGS